MVSAMWQAITDNDLQLSPLFGSTSNSSGGVSPSATESSQLAIEVPQTYSTTVQIEFPVEHPLRFRVPYITLNISDEDRDGIFVVTDTFSRVYGEGGDHITAIKDYLSTLLDHFLDLEHHEDILSPGLYRDLGEMRRYIIRTR